MKNKVLAVFLSVLMCLSYVNLFPVSAEEVSEFPYATGVHDETLEEFVASTGTEIINSSSRTTTADLPKSVDLSTHLAFPPIDSQGEISSCVGWATTYYQFTYEVNKLRNLPSKKVTTDANGNIREERIDENVYSPSWTYNYINQGVDEGSKESKAYLVLKNQGAMKIADYPCGNSEETYSFEWSNDIPKMTEALEYRAIPKSCSAVNSSNLATVKENLAAGHAAVIITEITGWVVMENTDGQEVVVCGRDGNRHAMTVVGYDDEFEITVAEGIKLTGAFKLANSWGTDFGNDGYIWVAYDALNPTSEFGTDWQNEIEEITIDERAYKAEEREPIFLTGNGFTFIDVYQCDVTFAGYAKYISTAPYDVTLYAGESTLLLRKKWDYPHGCAAASTTSHYIVFDFFSLIATDEGDYVYEGDTYNLNNCLTSSWVVSLYDSSAPATLKMYAKVIDNFGDIIAPTAELQTTLRDGKATSTTTINLAKGRVTAYDNSAITTDDSALVLDFVTRNVALSNVQIYLADYNSDGAVSLADVTAMNSAIAARNGQSYVITDEVEGWGCSLADVIEEEYNIPIEQYVAENYAELSAMNVIPAEMELALY